MAAMLIAPPAEQEMQPNLEMNVRQPCKLLC